MQATVQAELEAELGGPPAQLTPVAGGDMAAAFRWRSNRGETFFVKLYDQPAMVVAEAEGLAALRRAGFFLTPRVLTFSAAHGYLVLAWFDATHPCDAGYRSCGERLARQHWVCQASRFGWASDNFIGRLPQFNTWSNDWASFWLDMRLRPMLQRAIMAGWVSQRLVERIERLAERRTVWLHPGLRPALLHGDLWSGNVAYVDPQTPIIFDPAIYYGDREVELAFTELFGGFGPEFYAAYQATAPLDPGYTQRRSWWQLYPLLVHVNLFGRSYVSRLERAVVDCERAWS